MITWEEFARVELRVGTIISAQSLPNARKPAYLLELDMGPSIGKKKSSAQITEHYSPEELVGKQVLAVCNFPPKQIGKIMSEVLVTGVPDSINRVVLLAPDQKVPNGSKLF
jgi:tRNA-binding protein